MKWVIYLLVVFLVVVYVEDRFQHETCTYWEVARPTTEQTWIIGWVKECGGIMSPVVALGPEESPEEVILRLEKVLGIQGGMNE